MFYIGNTFLIKKMNNYDATWIRSRFQGERKKNFNQTFQCDIFLIEESREKISISSFSRSECSARKNLLMAY